MPALRRQHRDSRQVERRPWPIERYVELDPETELQRLIQVSSTPALQVIVQTGATAGLSSVVHAAEIELERRLAIDRSRQSHSAD
jgi:hypothetical protein